MIRSALLLAATALLGNTQPPDDPAALTDCILGYAQQAATAAKLDAFRTRPGDLMTAEKDEVTDYDASGLLALDVTPTKFSVNDILDKGLEEHRFIATLDMPYPQARVALIARMDRECDHDNTGIVKSCFFDLPRDDASGFDMSLSIRRVNLQESQLICRYSRKTGG